MEEEIEYRKYSQQIANISIKLHNFQGLEFIDDETNFKIIAKSSTSCEIFGEEESFYRTCDKYLKIYFTFSIDTNDEEEIFRLFSTPIYLTLVRTEKDELEEIAFASIDVLPLFTNQREERTISLSFRNFTGKKFIRKITFDAQISSDLGLLKALYENYILISIVKIYNLKHDLNEQNNDSLMDIGFKIPLAETFNKNLSSKINLSMLNAAKCDLRMKKWCDKSHISNSIYRNELYIREEEHNDQLAQIEKIDACGDVTKLEINTIMRSMFAPHTFYKHIRKSKRFAIEVIWNCQHLFGFIDCEKLQYLNRKRIRQLVQLFEFNDRIFKNFCNYESVFESVSNNIQMSCSCIEADIFGLNDKFEKIGDKSKIFVLVEIELEKPLNMEFHQELTDLCDTIKIPDNRFLEQFKYELLLISRQLIKKYDLENIDEIIKKLISNGEYSQVKQQMTNRILNLEKSLGSLSQSRIKSYVINSSMILSTDNLLISEIYSILGLDDDAECILLSNIAEDRNSETAWCDFLIFHAKRQNFDQMSVGINEMLKINQKSLIGNIIMAYKCFKIQKIDECLNVIHFLKTTHGALEELNIIEYVVNRMVGNENVLSKSSIIENNDVVKSVYERNEIIWISTRKENFINWKNQFIRCAVFCIKIGCYDFADLCLGEYYTTYGANFNYLYLLAIIDSSRGDYSRSINHLTKISKDDVANHHVHYEEIIKFTIINLLLSNKIDQGKTLYNTYFNHKCDNFLISYLLGMYYKNKNDFVIAKKFLFEAVKQFSCHLSFQAFAECLTQLNDFYQAENYFKMAINSNINAYESWKGLAEIYEMQERNEASKLCSLKFM